MKAKILSAVMLSCACLSAHAGSCIVQDPSPTPLNVRNGIWGKITDKLPDGKQVQTLRAGYDKNGREWVKIFYYRGNDYREGWVNRSLLSCD